ncbi:MAG: hypothetical protein MUD01_16365 [Chloroflexaceae bacterium]|nr:hypothetical protein [Chloroflexaceae bacterium]
MIQASTPTVDGLLLERPQARVWRLSPRVFWSLVGVEMVILAAALLWALNMLPASTPLTASGNIVYVQDAVWARLMGTVNDPLIEVQPGINVRESNMRGLSVDGTTYFYYVEGNQNFDPLSRGAVSENQVDVLLRDTRGPLPLVVYTIPNNQN